LIDVEALKAVKEIITTHYPVGFTDREIATKRCTGWISANRAIENNFRLQTGAAQQHAYGYQFAL
jgi:hypothetical protein